MNLILRPSGLPAPRNWSLQLRSHESVGETEYHTVAHVSRDVADEIIKAGATFWLFGDPDDGALLVATLKADLAEQIPMRDADAFTIGRLTAALATARREGAEDMRERAGWVAAATSCPYCGGTPGIIKGAPAAIHSLPLDAPTRSVLQESTDA